MSFRSEIGVALPNTNLKLCSEEDVVRPWVCAIAAYRETRERVWMIACNVAGLLLGAVWIRERVLRFVMRLGALMIIIDKAGEQDFGFRTNSNPSE